MMERMTERGEGGIAYYPQCFKEPCEGMGCKIEQCKFSEAACDRLAAYEDSELSPEDAANLHAILRLGDGMTLMRLRELAVADQEGRVVVLPCKVGERWTDEDGRAVRITAVIVSIEPFGMNINIYFDYEDATPDDAGSDCVTNWDYFSRHHTCIEAERAMEEMEGKKDG